MKFKKGFELSNKPQGEMLDIEWLPSKQIQYLLTKKVLRT